jgi:excinuclease ABC subunit A
MSEKGNIIIRGAKVNNLKNITVEIPRNKFVVITGISGSGKSSLAFDTLFAEGQRRFAESLSSYARQFLGRMSKPDVESIEGIPPAIAIEQKVNIRNPRSTVATTTEIYDYLRIIFARIGRTYSPISGKEVKCHSVNDVMASILKGDARAIYIMADVDWDARKDKVELMLKLKEEGYSRFYGPDGMVDIEDIMKMAGKKEYPSGLCLLVDRLKLPDFKGCYPYNDDGSPWAQTDWDDLQTRLRSSIDTAFREGDGKLVLRKEGDKTVTEEYSNRFELDGMTFREPDEYLFSFNSPLGACPTCGGLGKIIGISEDLVP